MVLAWTIADVRYRFRIRTAPIPLLGITFSVVSTIGLLTLLTDLWRTEQWLVPKGSYLTPGLWQAFLGGLFFLTFLIWTWFAFIKPPIYGKLNSERFALTLYRFVINGSPEDLAVIADEISSSALKLVYHATDRSKLKNIEIKKKTKSKKIPKVEAYANDLLLLIADRRLCQSIVKSSPVTALAVFDAMAELQKFDIQVETFAKNIVNEALINKNSFLFHESEGYESGLIGYHKPLSQAMFANYEMVEKIGTLLDPQMRRDSELDAAQWEAYCRIVLMTFSDYVEKRYASHSSVLYRALGYIKNAASDLYTLNDIPSIWGTQPYQRLCVVVQFIEDLVKILDKNEFFDYVRIRIREKHGHPHETLYDYVASMIFEVIFYASGVNSPQWGCWMIQHNSVWSKIFNSNNLEGPAGKLVKFKLRRLLYDEIVDMKRFPNFKGAKTLGFCLNVMGLKVRQGDYSKDSRALQKAVLAWTKKNFLWLHSYNPRVAESCLVAGITFEIDKQRLVRTYPVEGLRREPNFIYLELDSILPESTAVGSGFDKSKA